MQPRTVEEITAWTGGILLQGAPHTVVRGVSTDSRTVAPDDLFVPLPGSRTDGHQFVAAALERGASGSFIARNRMDVFHKLRQDHPRAALVVIPDPLHGLHLMAAEARRQLPGVAGRVVAVTGSVGKTTTKDMLAAMSAQRWRTTGTEGNYNNEIGLPLTVLKADDRTEALVLEMGMRGVGEIRQLARIARPDVGVVTNVSEVHLGPLGSVERIASAKRELIDELPADGGVVLNGDDARVRAMAAHARGRVLFFGRREDNDVRAAEIRSLGAAGVGFVLIGPGIRWPLVVPVPGRHNVYNALAASSAALLLGLEREEIVQGLAQFGAVRSDMRLQLRHRSDGVLIIDDVYNAGPKSMAAALDVLAEVGAGRRRVAVLGDMLELGSIASAAHDELGRRAANAGVDVLIAVGEYGPNVAAAARKAGLDKQCVHVRATAGEAAEIASGIVRPGDVVLVKASRGIALETVVDGLLGAEKEPAPSTKEVRS